MKKFRSIGRGVLGACVGVCMAMSATSAAGQCPGQWVAGEGVPGADNWVNAMAVLPDGDVVVGGNFTSMGGQSMSYIGRYDPQTKAWSAMGPGVNGVVNAIAVLPDGDVVVGGAFTVAGAGFNYGISRYNWASGNWTAMGSGTSSTVLAIAVLPGGDVVAGGFFGHASDVPGTRYIARYNWASGAWTAMGGGASSVVSAIAVLPDGDVLAGGGFTVAGGGPGEHIARYHPESNTWSEFAAGTNGWVHSLLVLSQNEVMVGGTFRLAGTTPVFNLARLNPTTSAWSTVGDGVNLTVYTMALRGRELFVGGYFQVAAGVSANNIVRYDLVSGAPIVLGPASVNGTDASVFTVVVLPGSDILVGGEFGMAGGTPASRFARFQTGPVLVSQPEPSAECPVGMALFGVAIQSDGPLSTDWQLEASPGLWITLTNAPTPLPGGGSAFGADFTVNSVLVGVRNRLGPFNVRCVVTDSCATAVSESGLLTICTADFNCSGTVTLQDLFDFLTAWFGSDPSADVNGQSGVSLQDIFDYLGAWFAGCA